MKIQLHDTILRPIFHWIFSFDNFRLATTVKICFQTIHKCIDNLLQLVISRLLHVYYLDLNMRFRARDVTRFSTPLLQNTDRFQVQDYLNTFSYMIN